MKIAAMMRVKNEARWIERAIASVFPVASSGVFVLDDGSDDDTALLARRSGATVFSNPFAGLNEVRDKNYLLCEVMCHADPDWVVHIDGDEVLERRGQREIVRLVSNGAAGVESYALPVLYLWDAEDSVRTDGVYGRFQRPSLFRTRASDLVFRSLTDAKAGFHCGNVPADVRPRCASCDVRIKHYGYLDRAMRLRKYAFYNRVDPDNEVEDRYRHMVQGDLPEVPTTASLKHAGPLRLSRYVERC